jgi:outer membrane receptor protein involved in Fe transport
MLWLERLTLAARRYRLGIALLCGCLLVTLAPRAFAQLGTGTITGEVRDASNEKPLAFVVVTATSPALQGEELVTTDASGRFRIPNLPPGEYALRYELAAFRVLTRAGVFLRASVTLRVDGELLPELLQAPPVTVVGEAPTVDVGSARTGVTLNEDFTRRLPLAPPTGKGGAWRSFEALAEVAPTARRDFYGVSIAGTTSPENLYFIDGLSVGDPALGYLGTPLSLEFVKETSVITSGYLPEYGRGAGGVLDVITKSGSNEFHGSVFGNLSPFQASPKFPPPQDAISTTRRLAWVADFGTDLGGPIVRDKLWFYVGVDVARASYSLNRSLNAFRTSADGAYVRDADGLLVSDPIPGSAQTYRAEQTSFQYIGKLTYAAGRNDRIELVHSGTPTRSGGHGSYSLDPETGFPYVFAEPDVGNIIGPYGTTAEHQVFDAFDTSVHWTHSSLEKKLTFDTLVGWHYEHRENGAVDGSSLGENGLAGTPLYFYRRTNPEPHSITDFEHIGDPSLCDNPVPGGDAKCPVARYVVGGPQLLEDNRYHRLAVREVATYVTEGLGHHVVKAGIDGEYTSFGAKRGYPGGVVYRENSDGSLVSDYRSYGGLTAPDDAYTITELKNQTSTLSVGAFLQDSWAILDKVTLNAGLRYDTELMFADEGLGLALPNQWSPRIGAIFDPTQTGHAKIFANYAIYYQGVPLNIMSRAGSAEPELFARRPSENCAPGVAGYPKSCSDPSALLSENGSADPNQHYSYVGTNKLVIDPNLRPPSSSEVSAGAEYELIPHGRVSLTYLRRWTNNVIEDMSRDEGGTFFLGNPGRGIASDFPKAERTYDAGILAFTKTFSDAWLAQASYTLSYLRGNWGGFFQEDNHQLDPGTNSDFDLKELTVNRTGPLPGDHRHEIKLHAARDFALAPEHHVNVGASYRALSGAPTNFLGSHVLYGPDAVFLLPRGSGERLPWQHTVDLHLGYAFVTSKYRTLSVTCDIFNLLNFQAVTQRGETYTERDVNPITGSAQNGALQIDPSRVKPADGDPRPFDASDKNRSFGAPLAYQEPLTIRFGMRTTF